MKILFISSQFPMLQTSSNIYTDLAEELIQKGHYVKVVVSEERKNIDNTIITKERGLDILRVKCGNIYGVNLVEKTFTFLTISNKLIKALKKYCLNDQYDLILFSSPPVTFNKVIKWAMNHYKCPSYLMMKDIFPQNGLDIGLYTKFHPIYIYFKGQEKKLYQISSKIGCMSPMNIDYLNKHSNVPLEKLELFPNTVKILKHYLLSDKEKESIRSEFGISKNDIVAVFGGNFGRPQGLDFLLDIIEKYRNKSNVKFLLVGTGTEKNKIFNYIKKNNLNNAITKEYIPREKYEKLLSTCDIGLIFLDHRFTIPNFPSKTLSYFECALPILAAIDTNNDYGDMLKQTNSGLTSVHGDLKEFKKNFDILIKDKNLRKKMGENGRKYYEKNCNVEQSVAILENYMRRIYEK